LSDLKGYIYTYIYIYGSTLTVKFSGSKFNPTRLIGRLHLVVVGELKYPSDPESYAAGSVATGRVTLGGQVEG